MSITYRAVCIVKKGDIKQPDDEKEVNGGDHMHVENNK
jgi:hypothetical protein